MNRLKVWVFTLLVVAGGYFLAHAAATGRRADVVAGLDARLASAAAQLTASTAALGREASAAAGLVARDDGLAAALLPREPAPPPPQPPPVAKGKKAPPPPVPAAPEPGIDQARLHAAASAALDKAEKTLGFDLPQGTFVTVATREALARASEPAGGESEPSSLLRAAAAGQARRSVVRQGAALWYAAARPAGDGAAVMVLVPLDEAWARRLATAAGADVTVAVPDVKPFTTWRSVDLPLIQAATKLTGAGDVGLPGRVDVSVGPLKLPKLPQPIPGGAPIRARAVPLEGLKGGYAVVSLPATGAVNAPARFLWDAVGGLVLVLVAGFVVGLLVRSADPTPQVPDELLAAAARIEKGDFAARAPQLAGKLGTLASALNRAAELAGPAAASLGTGAAAAVAPTEERFLAAVRAAEEPRTATSAAIPAAGPTRTATVTAVSAPITGAALEVDEETHWQGVFQDFLRTRSACGESTEGLTYEKFRGKLEANKAQLVAKYACKTVRFQVYVKEGKTALKATPVK